MLSNACRKLKIANENRTKLVKDKDTLPVEMV